ncbi:MAG: hypothetical protein AB1730_22030 [Myxococcota bacterium]
MKKRLAVAVMFVSALSFAQEIGTEITPVTPNSSATTPAPADNPYAQPNQGQPPQQPQQQKQGYQYRPSGQKADTPSFEGPRVSAAAGDFGIRAGFGASGSTSVSGSGATLSIGAPAVGISYWATDEAALSFDLGFGMAIPERGDPPVALLAKVGLDYHFRNPGLALRPLFAVAASFNMLLVGGNATIGVSAELGGGAAYFFSPSFSITGKLLLSVPMTFSPNFSIAFFTLTPGVAASWYF